MSQPYRPLTPHSLVIFSITVSTTLSLIATLSYLQLLYTASFILSPRSSNRNPVLQDTIQRIEKHTVGLILRILPASAFRSPQSSCLLHEDPRGHRFVSSAHSTPRVQLSNVSSTSTVTPYVTLQCYPVNAVERPYPGPSTQPDPSTQLGPRTDPGTSRQLVHDLLQPFPENRADQTRAGPTAY